MPALSVKPGPEPFNKADVATYVQTHRLPRVSLDTSKPLEVESLEFIGAADVPPRLHGALTGLAASERVGFVVMRGAFMASAPRAKEVPAERGYAVFSASTGNLVMFGILPQ
jgi:hypothetical protein